ncbi:MAG TPA: Clp protease N-terminal domain-containing protein [Bryobacteraceae bacterium]
MSEKIYAWMLKLYPAQFRQKYEVSAMQLFRDRLRAERGFSRRLRFWLDVIADLIVSLPREHWRQTTLRPSAAVVMTRSGFKRYITQSRRAIFFARYEASHAGSVFIEPEHLLLGILRSDEDLAIRLFKTKENIESIVRQVRATFSLRRKVPTSGDLPLSFECKRILAYGADEAERRHARHIEPQHILLGLLRDERSATAKIMLEHGVVPSFLENRSDQS